MLLSSLVMISLGRVYDGLMVDVQASNRKLVRRSERILSRLSGRGHEDVQAALGRAGGSVKLAFLLLQGYQPGEAQTALDRADGHLRRAMSLIGEFHEDALEGTQASIAAGSSEPATHE
jgi:N-acetylmuramic acid 6-phosphate etherase